MTGTTGDLCRIARFIPLMESIRILRRGRGRPRKRPCRTMCDKAYSSRVNLYLRRHGIQAEKHG